MPVLCSDGGPVCARQRYDLRAAFIACGDCTFHACLQFCRRVHFVVFVPYLTTYYFSSLGLAKDIARFALHLAATHFHGLSPQPMPAIMWRLNAPAIVSLLALVIFHLSRSIVIASGGKVARQPMQIGVHWCMRGDGGVPLHLWDRLVWGRGHARSAGAARIVLHHILMLSRQCHILRHMRHARTGWLHRPLHGLLYRWMHR